MPNGFHLYGLQIDEVFMDEPVVLARYGAHIPVRLGARAAAGAPRVSARSARWVRGAASLPRKRLARLENKSLNKRR